MQAAGAVFLAESNGTVIFRDPESGQTLTLYSFAVTPETVSLTLKNAREPIRDFAPLAPSE